MNPSFRCAAKWPQLVLLFLGLFIILAAGHGTQKPLLQTEDESTQQVFTLRHIFHHDLDPDRQAAAFADVALLKSSSMWTFTQTVPEHLPIKVHKPSATNISVEHLIDDLAIQAISTSVVPNITDRDTIINLATMTSDAYYASPAVSGWRNLSQGFNDSLPFGFDSDGLRGHVFANMDNSTVIIAFKGTDIYPGDKTRTKDKLNDNMLFSCCCATQRPAPFWYGKVCDCRARTYTCNATCLSSELSQPDRYYSIASAVVKNVTNDLFPSANLWVTGHSLGGALASLMGLTYDLPAVSFEAPPERLPAQRLGLIPLDGKDVGPRSRHTTYHFGNTADPIFMGACNGATSFCAATGYSFESQCFTGKRCIYDTMGDKGWHSSISNHPINTVIDSVLKVYDNVVECVGEDPECVDCAMWNFYR